MPDGLRIRASHTEVVGLLAVGAIARRHIAAHDKREPLVREVGLERREVYPLLGEHVLLESDFLDRPDPAKGRFRGYLVGTLKHFLAQHFERVGAAKRGGETSLSTERPSTPSANSPPATNRSSIRARPSTRRGRSRCSRAPCGCLRPNKRPRPGPGSSPCCGRFSAPPRRGATTRPPPPRSARRAPTSPCGFTGSTVATPNS